MAVTGTEHDLLSPAVPGGTVVIGNYIVCFPASRIGAGGELFDNWTYFSILNTSTLVDRGFGGLASYPKPPNACGEHQGRAFCCGNGAGYVGSARLSLVTPATGAVETITTISTGNGNQAVSCNDHVWVKTSSGSSYFYGINPTDSSYVTSDHPVGSLGGIASTGTRVFTQTQSGSGITVREMNSATGVTINSWTQDPFPYMNGRGLVRGSSIFWESSGQLVSFNTSTGAFAQHPFTPAPGPSVTLPLTLGPDGYIYWCDTSDNLGVFDPDTGRWKVEPFPIIRAYRSADLAVSGGKLWSPAGEPIY